MSHSCIPGDVRHALDWTFSQCWLCGLRNVPTGGCSPRCDGRFTRQGEAHSSFPGPGAQQENIVGIDDNERAERGWSSVVSTNTTRPSFCASLKTRCVWEKLKGRGECLFWVDIVLFRAPWIQGKGRSVPGMSQWLDWDRWQCMYSQIIHSTDPCQLDSWVWSPFQIGAVHIKVNRILTSTSKFNMTPNWWV